MRDLLAVFLHAIITVCRIVGSGGVRFGYCGIRAVETPVAWRIVLTPPPVFDRAHENGAANDTIGDSHLWIRTL